MPLFQQSSLTFAQAKTKIARAASAENDLDMLVKAGDALESAVQTWNNRKHWNFLRLTHVFSTVASFTAPSCSTVIDSTTVSLTGALFYGIVVGDLVTGIGLPAETYVVSIGSVSFVVTRPATSTEVSTICTFSRSDFAMPTAFKYIYSVLNSTIGNVIYPEDSRVLDRITAFARTPNDPLVYDMHPYGEVGKIRLFPTPISAQTIVVKYYRRMTVPSVEGTPLDIPIDFEWGILSEAKGLFLADKGGYNSQAAFWAAKASDALAFAILADNKQPDAEPGFSISGGGGYWSPGNSVATTDFLED